MGIVIAGNKSDVKFSWINYYVDGVVILLAALQILSIPLMLFEVNFNIYCGCVAVLIVVLLIVSITIIKKIVYGPQKKFKKNYFKNIWFWGAVLLISLQILYITTHQRFASDDSFYLGWINSILESNYLYSCDPSTGTYYTDFVYEYKMVGYEPFLAFLSEISKVNVAILCHTVLPILFLVTHYFVLLSFFSLISAKRKYFLWFLWALIISLSGYASSSLGASIMGHLWHGKVAFSAIIIPFVCLKFLRVFIRGGVEKKDLFLFACGLYAGFFLTTVGLYLTMISYGIYSLSFVLYKKQIIANLRLAIPIMLALPYIGIRFYQIFFLSDRLQQYTEYAGESYLEQLQKVAGGAEFVCIWALAIVIICIFGNRIKRYLFSIYAIIMFLTVLNPFLMPWVSTHITGVAVYWRLFWLLQGPLPIVVAVDCLCEFFCVDKNTVYVGMTIFMCGYMYLMWGVSVNLPKAENAENIDAEVVIWSNVIEDDWGNDVEYPLILAPKNYCHEFRQYTGKVKIIWTKYVEQNSKLFPEENWWTECNDAFYDIYENDNFSNLNKYVNDLHINYIILSCDKLDELTNVDYLQIYNDGNMSLLRIN
jgi:hypothetical protein